MLIDQLTESVELLARIEGPIEQVRQQLSDQTFDLLKNVKESKKRKRVDDH